MKIFAEMNVYTGDPGQRSLFGCQQKRAGEVAALIGKAKRKQPLFLVGKPTKAQ